jgi:hypothetical protein
LKEAGSALAAIPLGLTPAKRFVEMELILALTSVMMETPSMGTDAHPLALLN